MSKARRLEIEKRTIKDILFFLSSFQRLGRLASTLLCIVDSVILVLQKEALPSFNWKQIYYCVQEISPLLDVVDKFRQKFEYMKLPMLNSMSSVLDSYQEASKRIKVKVNTEISALFTFQGYLKCAPTPKNPFLETKKNPFISENPFVQAEEPSPPSLPASEFLFMAACICDLIGEKFSTLCLIALGPVYLSPI